MNELDRWLCGETIGEISASPGYGRSIEVAKNPNLTTEDFIKTQIKIKLDRMNEEIRILKNAVNALNDFVCRGR